MGLKVTNNAYAVLNASITSSATTIVLVAGQGARFPTLSAGDYFYATLIDTSNNLEIVKVTARSTDTLTVVRGQDNTTARAYATNDRFELRPTAALFNEKANANEYLPLAGGTLTGDVDLSKTNGRLRLLDGSKAMAIGQWDGTNNRLESSGANGLIVQYGAGNTLALSHASAGDFLIGDSSGRVRMPFKPAFEVKISSSLACPSSYTTIVFDVAVRNQGSNFSTSTGLFTAPVSGVYHFSFNALYYATAEGVLVDLNWRKNGASIVDMQCTAPAGSHFQRQLSNSLYLSANDTLGIQHRTTGSTNLYAGQTYFTGVLLG
jgi:hypothetical protein